MNSKGLEAKDVEKLRPLDRHCALTTCMLFLVFLLLACSAPQVQQRTNAQPQVVNRTAELATPGKLPLRTLTDVSLTGGTTRLDYQSLDSVSGRLYIAHLILV